MKNKVPVRDRVVWWIAIRVLRLASPSYQMWLNMTWTIGQMEIERRLAEGDSDVLD